MRIYRPLHFCHRGQLSAQARDRSGCADGEESRRQEAEVTRRDQLALGIVPELHSHAVRRLGERQRAHGDAVLHEVPERHRRARDEGLESDP